MASILLGCAFDITCSTTEFGLADQLPGLISGHEMEDDTVKAAVSAEQAATDGVSLAVRAILATTTDVYRFTLHCHILWLATKVVQTH